MTTGFHIVVCGSLVPDPLQTLEPLETPTGPGLKNEMMLPAVLDAAGVTGADPGRAIRRKE